MTMQELKTIKKALDDLGIAMIRHLHTWTADERKGFEDADRILRKELQETKPEVKLPSRFISDY